MARQKSKDVTVAETCAKVTEALKALGGKGTVAQLKGRGCTYIEIQSAVTAKAIAKIGGNPVHEGADIHWVYKVASRQ